MKVILCGFNWIGCKALDLLLERNYEVFVYTHESPPHTPDLQEYCAKKNVKCSIKKISIDILPFEPDIICSIYYRYIIDSSIITLVKGKIFNLHPSLLPDYKGCSSLTWAMIDGMKYVGFTYHYLTRKVDNGNIIFQCPVKIEDWDLQSSLYYRVMFNAANSFLDVIDLIITDFQGIPQSTNNHYFKRGAPFNGEIDDNWEVEKIERFIRAMNFPPLPYAQYKDIEIKTYKDYTNMLNN